MAINTFNLSQEWLPVAVGPGNASFAFLDHPGEWTIHNSASPVGIFGGFHAEKDKTRSLTLVAGEWLHLRGRQTARVVADTLV